MNTPLKHYILLLLLLAIATLANAQQFGGNPPSIKWDQINTPAAKVIFPAGLDSSALIVANIVNQMNAAIQPTIGFKQRQVSILLQNQTTVPNAYVGLAPFRSEFYLTPEQNSFELGSLPWPEQLAIHEFRHVQQYNNFDVGFSKVLRTLFGEGGQAVGNELSIPNWFFEGDAVFNETHVSEQGRGRLPYFFNGFRALWADGRDYSYMKIRNGSYVDYTPDWYPLGYMLVSYGREKYGDDFWKKVTHDAAAFKGGLYPFERAVKKYSGVDFDTFRNDAYHHFMTAFKSDVPADKVSTHKHFNADREYPAYINDTTLIYMKSTYNHNPAFVVSIGNKERKISTRSYSIDNYFDYHDGKIVYASYRSDLRWNYRDYSELMILDVNTGKEHRITTKAKYFAPSFSPDGKTIVTVRVGPSGKSELHLLNGADGHLITTVPNKDRLFFTYPKFYGDDKLVSAVRTSEGKMSLAVISIKTGEVKYLLPFSYQPIAFPHIKNDTVYFSATHDIHDILCALSIKTGKLYKWDDPESLYGFIGKYEPAISNKKIAWVWFSADGYQIKEKNRDKIDWTQITDQQLQSGLPDMNISALKRDASTDLLGRVVDSSLKVTKYSKAYHLFNFHSLIPSIDDPNYTLSLSGENVLNTFQSDLSLTYNRDEGYKQFGFDAMYGALFPYIYGGVNYTLDRRAYYRGGNVYWNETNVYGGLELPLNFSEGKHFTYLTIGSDVNYSDTHFQAAYRNMFDDQAYTYLNSYITFSSSNQQPRQNIYPTFGQTIRFDYKNAISGLTASQFLADGNFYFPGFFTNHNFVLTLAHQQKGNTDNVIDFSNDFPFARGYTAENLYKLNGGSLNYALPLLYPDAGLANTVYFQRVRGNVFFDYTHATDFYTNGNVFKGDFRSTGLEIYFDTKWFNQDGITFGFRYSRLLNDDLFGGYGRNRFEFIVPVSIF